MTDIALGEIIARKDNYLGLSSAEAKRRLAEFGFNSRPAVKEMTWLKRLWHIFSEPMMLLILTVAAVYFVIGENFEGFIVLLSIVPIGLIEFFQEHRTDEAIKILDKMMVDHCQVYRDGQLLKIEGKYLVPGDLVHLVAGDKIPADGFLLSSPGLQIDESVLTGESVTVIKAEVMGRPVELVEQNKLWQGTLIAQGEGKMLVTKTGGETAYGRLGNLLEKIKTEKTPLQKKIERLVRGVAVLAVIAAVLVALLLAWSRGLVAGLLGGLTMAMSLVPEEFPVVFSVFLIMGVWRLAGRSAMVRQMQMVETLGSATVICTDKTGTLTEGRMSLEKVYFNEKIYDLKKQGRPENFSFLITTALLSLERIASDPLEVEVQRYAGALKINLEDFYVGHRLLKDAPFSAKTKMVHHLWQDAAGECAQYSAGAPESILDICNLSPRQKEEGVKAFESLAKEGYRLIGVAKKTCAGSDAVSSSGAEFVGLLAMSDPPRVGVKEAIATCQQAGIKVIMVTGDNKLTARNIAESIGLKHQDEIFNGDDLEKMSPEELKQVVMSGNIFARVKPEQKFLIVKTLKEAGEVVAMTGDGVNDAPALKSADIGIAMGQKGTEVARAAAGIVLLDDNFSTIVEAVKEGRRIYDNLRKAFVFLFSFHLPIVGLAVLPLFFGEELVFLPVHVIFLELFCDPAAVLGFERERARRGLMEDPPRSVSEPLINPRLWGRILIQGLGILAVSFGFYYYFGLRGGNIELGRTLAFASLVFSQTLLIILTREWSQIKTNFLLTLIALLTFVVLILILTVPILRQIFFFTPINLIQAVWLVAAPFLIMSTISLFVLKKR
ncbi:MAG: cation-translocating P-type ATPase [Patescibacteria group bacterium]